MTKPIVLPFAKSLDDITQTGVYQTPNGNVQAHMYSSGPIVKEYLYNEDGYLADVIYKDGRHYTRNYINGQWTAWELKK